MWFLFPAQRASVLCRPGRCLPRPPREGARGNVRRHPARPDLRPRGDHAGLSPGGGSGNPAEFSQRPQCHRGRPCLLDAARPRTDLFEQENDNHVWDHVVSQDASSTRRKGARHPLQRKNRVLSYDSGRGKGVTQHRDCARTRQPRAQAAAAERSVLVPGAPREQKPSGVVSALPDPLVRETLWV